MPIDIFNISFEHWVVFLLSLIPAIINVGVFIYVTFYLSPTRVNQTFSLFVFLLGLIQILDGLMRMSLTADTAMFWVRAGSALYLFVCPIGLLFVLQFTGRFQKIHRQSLFSLLFLPAILLELLTSNHFDQYTIAKSQTWNWVANPEPTAITNVMFGWIVGIAMLMFIFLWLNYFQETNKIRKQQTLLLVVGFAFPLIAGVITEVIFPLILRIDSIPLFTPFVTFFSVSAIFAIKRYQFLDYSPRHQWQTIIKNMNEGILIVDNSDRIMYANNKFCEFVGYAFWEIKGKIASDLFVDNVEDKKLISNTLIERQEKKSSQYEVQIKTKSGEKIWILMNRSPYLDKEGKVIGSIGVQTNINHLKELENILEQKNVMLNLAQAIAHVGSWELNFTTGKAIWSKEACKIYGLLPEDKIHSFEEWTNFIHPEDLPYVQKEMQKFKATFSDSAFKHRIMLKDGTVKHIHSMSRFEMNEKGIPMGIYGTCQDITEQHKAEIGLIESENKIRNFASHLNTTLENERAYIAREVHDELGQYLTGIKLSLGSFINLFHGNDKIENRIEGMLTDIESAQQTVRKIVNKIRPGILDTLGLIPSIKWLVNEFEMKKETTYNIEIIGPEEKYKPNISICFFRVCQEALTNISRHANATRVDVTIMQTESKFILEISDNGKGISSAQLQNPFSTGLLGMKERANSIGANLQISSKENHGTTIQLELKIN